MICDYIDPDPAPAPEPSAGIEIQYAGKATIRQGGSQKKFTAVFSDPDAAQGIVQWDVTCDPIYEGKILYSVEDNTIRLSALDFVELQGAAIQLTATYLDSTASIVVEVTA